MRWQCRRGLLELDLVLMRFLNECYPTLDPSERELFGDLLAQPDARLLRWLQAQETPPGKFKHLLKKM